jgi:dihydroorotate dehydrogenase
LYSLIRSVLFLFDPEKVHYFTMGFISAICKIPFVPSIIRSIFQVKHPKLERKLFGLTFKNPVGLGAGFDKNARWIDELETFGFGFIEIGTLTPKPQPGNDKPRLFRLTADESIVNRMGFNNDGVEDAILRLRKRNKKVIVGGNIGKNKVTSNENAIDDYKICFQSLFDYVDYFVVNVSSPNTPNLRELQEKEPLTKLLLTLQKENLKKAKPKPILLKIAPDLSDSQLDDIVDIVKNTGIAGVIATNTTISRENLKTPKDELERIGAGGLSGKSVTQRSTEVIRYLSARSGGSFPIVGVGGIMDEKDALEKIRAGAALIQVYTGYIYKGPGLIKRINKALLRNNL